ncbi:hypothetical protein LFYK43_11780 [Ligilactobacillus salitolerans]|uniref:Uncharacterized protein n=1 Tax=Ligilactobacillus salitolerans TaxID=1808352 RepID=A0A401IT77_9LACO|nr:hypothetical protein LFYK43_11780 [Ligilactobacillus salitolerans]
MLNALKNLISIRGASAFYLKQLGLSEKKKDLVRHRIVFEGCFLQMFPLFITKKAFKEYFKLLLKLIVSYR